MTVYISKLNKLSLKQSKRIKPIGHWPESEGVIMEKCKDCIWTMTSDFFDVDCAIDVCTKFPNTEEGHKQTMVCIKNKKHWESKSKQ